MRKSLVCDKMEPFRPIIDWKIRTGINLGQFKEDDFVNINGQRQLEYKKSATYAYNFMECLLENKESIFLYIRSYYRAFMKELSIEKYPIFDLEQDAIVYDKDSFDYEEDVWDYIDFYGEDDER